MSHNYLLLRFMFHCRLTSRYQLGPYRLLVSSENVSALHVVKCPSVFTGSLWLHRAPGFPGGGGHCCLDEQTGPFAERAHEGTRLEIHICRPTLPPGRLHITGKGCLKQGSPSSSFSVFTRAASIYPMFPTAGCWAADQPFWRRRWRFWNKLVHRQKPAG